MVNLLPRKVRQWLVNSLSNQPCRKCSLDELLFTQKYQDSLALTLPPQREATIQLIRFVANFSQKKTPEEVMGELLAYYLQYSKKMPQPNPTPGFRKEAPVEVKAPEPQPMDTVFVPTNLR